MGEFEKEEFIEEFNSLEEINNVNDTSILEDSIEISDSLVEENKIGVILENLEELISKIEQMNQLFSRKISHTEHEEKIVDHMHAELQKYKQDMYAQLVRPILLDIIEIRDSILRMSASYASKPEVEQSIPLKIFSGYAYDVQDILEKNNINIYNSVEGDNFDAIKHKAIKKVITQEESLHGKIAYSVASGYEYLGRPISSEKVVVYVYEEQVNENQVIEEGEKNNG